MNKLSLMLGAIALSAIVTVGSAQATTLYNQNLADGVYFGSGNPNGGFATNTQNGVELGLRGKVYQGAVPTPVNDVYSFALGSIISVDYSYDPDVGGIHLITPGSSLLTIKNVLNGNSFSFDPSSILFGNATNVALPGAYQNSQRLNFNFLGLGYNANVDNTYLVDFTVGDQTVHNTYQLGAGAPGGGAVRFPNRPPGP